MSKSTPDYIKQNGDGSIDVTLATPAVLAGVKQTVIRLREPTVQDQLAMEAAGDSAAIQEISLFANLAEQSPEDVKRLTLKNYKRVQTAFGLFTD